MALSDPSYTPSFDQPEFNSPLNDQFAYSAPSAEFAPDNSAYDTPMNTDLPIPSQTYGSMDTPPPAPGFTWFNPYLLAVVGFILGFLLSTQSFVAPYISDVDGRPVLSKQLVLAGIGAVLAFVGTKMIV